MSADHITAGKPARLPRSGVPPVVLDIHRPEEFAIDCCHHGVRSGQDVGSLRRAGFCGLLNLAGGIEAWSGGVVEWTHACRAIDPACRNPLCFPHPVVYKPAMQPRAAQIQRDTNETRIRLKLVVDGRGRAKIRTGIPFFDHMLTLFAKHATMDLSLTCKGDLEVDAHHTVEDCGIALGMAFREALGDKKGLRRYGAGFDPRNPFTGEAHVPMDECLARCVVDFGGRTHLVWRGLNHHAYKTLSLAERSQDMSSAFRFGLAREFFQGFANEARCNLHLELLYGDEPHHVVEGLFKAFARAVDFACQRDPRIGGQLPSTKGRL